MPDDFVTLMYILQVAAYTTKVHSIIVHYTFELGAAKQHVKM